jgi:hypothetical protein
VPTISYRLVGTFSMSYIIEFYKLKISLIYAYAIGFIIKSNIGLYFGLS